MRRVTVCGVEAEVARSFWERAVGLIGRKSLAPGTGLLIERCNAIHTFFMKFPIDATFLDRRGRIVKVVRNIRPWRFLVWGGWRATQVLETATGAGRGGMAVAETASLHPHETSSRRPS